MHTDRTISADNRPVAKLRIVHLEDDEADRELVRQALLSEGFDCEVVYAGSHEEFERVLERPTFDLILSDFTLPGYDGSAALALAQEKCPGVPYLFVSGTIGEERAIDSLKGGATDYVLKNNLDRLLPAVRRALREAAERAKREAAEAALRAAEARFRSIFEQAVEGIYQATPQGRLLEANRAMARLCGYASPAELCAGVTDFARDLSVDAGVREAFVRLLETHGEVLGYESRLKRSDGSVIWISENARAVREAGGRLLYHESMVTDITARRAAEEALRASEERFREMAERIDDVYWSAPAERVGWLYVSPAYEQIWGRPLAELYARPEQWTDAVAPEDLGLVRDARAQLARGHESRIEYRIARPDGTQRWIRERSYPIRGAGGEIKRFVGVTMDITRQRQLESQLLHAQKMDAVGQLAGGVAHDFNNVLTVVTGYARLLLDSGTLPPAAAEGLRQIYTAGTRAANLTRQLLLFSRKSPVNRRVIDLNGIVDEMAKMLQRLIGEHIGLRLVQAQRTATIDADPGMMEQVLMNLAVNARDAMGGGGTLTVTTSTIAIKDPAARRQPDARAGDFVVLEVRDTGSGIAPENMPRIFEPFFTTKEAGHGTGLGLATVFGIVQQHHGWIEVESVMGAGTTFRILLPAVRGEAAPPPNHLRKPPEPQGGAGSETVLLVEDETSVREFAVAVLRSHGYRVLQAGSGLEAKEVWKWHGPRVALLFTDLVMPDGMSGVELAAALRRDKPTLRVVLTSGYANEAIGTEFRPPSGTIFLQKPYKPQALAQAVRDALDGNFAR